MPPSSSATMAMLRSDPLGPNTAGNRNGCHDRVAADNVDTGRIGEFHLVVPAVHTVGYQIEPRAHFGAGQSLADNPADHRLARPLPWQT
jgi:hypothetical protein